MAIHISGKLAILVSLIAFSLATGNAFAQSRNHTAADEETIIADPKIAINTGFATFSYGVVYVGITIQGAIPDLTAIEIKYYNPDGELEASRSESLSIYNGTGSFSCYCFGVERKYVEENYKVVVIYGDYSADEVMPPFSNSYSQPPSISFHASEQNDYGVLIGGRVSGGIAGEQVNVAIYSPDDGSPLWSKTINTNTKVIFDTSLPNSEAEVLLPTGTYQIVATHLATGITGETTLVYTNPSSPDVSDLEPTPEPEPTQQPQQPVREPDERNEQSEEEPIENNSSDGTIRSPFIFSDENENQVTTARLSSGTDSVAQPINEEDVLIVNGTLASYYVLDNTTAQDMIADMTQVYVLSGNWSMTVNNTTITDFAADFTIVRADGAARSAYSLANFTPVDNASVQFEQDTMMLTSTAGIQEGDNAANVNMTITIEKLSVIKMQFAADQSKPVDRPIYGLVDSLVLISTGEESVMPR